MNCTGQMLYERFQNLDLDKAELEVFKLFFFGFHWAWFESALSFLTSNGKKLVRGKRGNNITTSFVALSPCKHA
ncbi:hypothetical protein N7447_007555 [Penicillium robsamsonii]|uniref:uncharacterized protein n=1 Tax=Penicillium robsamsonii TaxID=1792511 RepID=UPI0025485F20|nr:uncharacterized protein N7447_007555 [Penicillium robsamsonii]KAJ5817547.1 hypothetical protein N7447_007555 [Penicillium robsamsonii]